MNYKKSLQIVFSQKEKAEKQLQRLNSYQASDENEKRYVNQTRGKNNTIIQTSNQEIFEIKQKIDQEIDEKKELLSQYKIEYNNVNTALKIGEITGEESEKRKVRIKKKFNKENEKYKEFITLQKSSSSEDVGGYIDPDKKKSSIFGQIKDALEEFIG